MRLICAAVTVVLMVFRPEPTTPLSPLRTTLWATVRTTTSCPAVECYYATCRTVPGSDGCPRCDCDCDAVTCDPGTTCVVQDCHGSMCLPFPICVPQLDTTTPTPPQTTFTNCPTIEGCTGTCHLVYNVGVCPVCLCVDPPPQMCLLVTCAPGEECVTTNESPYYSCVPRDTTIPATTPCIKFELPACRPECVYEIQGDDCIRCVCPCEGVVCPEGEVCVQERVNWATEAHFRPTKCVPISSITPSMTPSMTPTTGCAMTSCRLDCFRSSDSNGCAICDCPPTCEGVVCPEGEVCVQGPIDWISEPHFQPVKCVPISSNTPTVTTATPTTWCPTVSCQNDCYYASDSNGCPICDCPPSCETVKCSAGYECQLVDVDCGDRYPCFPQAQCVSIEDPCTGTPNKSRCDRARNRWTYNSLTNTCEKFVYYGCTPSFNTFTSPKACKNKCKPVCAAVFCEPDCYTLTRKNKCPKCICPNPCRGIRCRAGYECKVRVTKCHAEPEPFCSPKP